MATVQDLQLNIAYRLGEQSAPNDLTEKARRLSYLNAGYNDIMRRNLWWFTEYEATLNSVASKEYYDASDGLPTDVRSLIEVRFNGNRYTKVTQNDVLSSLTKPYRILSQSYFLFKDRMYFTPAIPTTLAGGIAIKYYRKHVKLTSDADTILIPDEFCDILASYTEGRIWKVKDERGSAADAFEEYAEILKDMQAEQNRYYFGQMDTAPDLTAEYD
jgi:hypothetical protein